MKTKPDGPAANPFASRLAVEAEAANPTSSRPSPSPALWKAVEGSASKRGRAKDKAAVGIARDRSRTPRRAPTKAKPKTGNTRGRPQSNHLLIGQNQISLFEATDEIDENFFGENCKKHHAFLKRTKDKLTEQMQTTNERLKSYW